MCTCSTPEKQSTSSTPPTTSPSHGTTPHPTHFAPTQDPAAAPGARAHPPTCSSYAPSTLCAAPKEINLSPSHSRLKGRAPIYKQSNVLHSTQRSPQPTLPPKHYPLPTEWTLRSVYSCNTLYGMRMLTALVEFALPSGKRT